MLALKTGLNATMESTVDLRFLLQNKQFRNK